MDEQVEDVRQHIGGDAAPVVGHRDFGAAVDLPRRDPDGAARIRVFGGVGEQVRDDLRETTRIGFDEEAGSRHVEAQQMIPFWLSCLSIEARSRSISGVPRSRSSSTAVRIGANGLRSSCPSIARNSSLRRFASRSCDTSSTRSVMSEMRIM